MWTIYHLALIEAADTDSFSKDPGSTAVLSAETPTASLTSVFSSTASSIVFSATFSSCPSVAPSFAGAKEGSSVSSFFKAESAV